MQSTPPSSPFYSIQLMQQIAKFDHELNYLPYRYRYRSNTNPKKNQQQLHTYSYSRGKNEKHNPQKISWDHRIVAIEQDPANKQSIQENGDGYQNRERQTHTCEGKVEDKAGNIEEEQQAASQLYSEQAISFQEVQAEREIDQEASPIMKLNQLPSCHKPENYQAEVLQMEQVVRSPQKISSIFNQSDVREIKESILNNIRHSESQNELFQEQAQVVDRQYNPPQSAIQSRELHPVEQKMNFDAKFERLRTINQQYEQNQQFNRNLKCREMIKKAKKVKPRHLNNKLHVIDGVIAQKQATPLTKSQYSLQPINSNKKVQFDARDVQSKLSISPSVIAEDKRIQYSKKQQLQWMGQLQKQRQGIFNNHSCSINTTHSSYVKHRQEKPKSNEILTFDKYKQRMKAKETSIERKNADIKAIPPKKDERQAHQLSAKKMCIHPIEIETREYVKIQPPKEKQSQIPAPDLLYQFTKSGGSTAIAEIRQAKSRGKQQPQQLSANNSTPATVGYGNRQFPPSSYKGKHIQNETYSANMKKKKEKATTPIIKPLEKDSNQAAIALKNQLDKIREQACSMHVHESLKEPVHTPSQQYSNNNAQFKEAKQKDEICKIAESDLAELQEGIAYFLNSEQNCNRSSKARSHESSHPTSRVYERHNLEELKSEDGEELLKIMAVNANFKELSSLVFEDRSPEQHNLSLSHELYQIINSNQSEFSATPTPQNVQLSSSSLQYPFEEEEESENALEANEQQGFVDADGSAFIQINEDSRVFQERLTFPAEPVIPPFFAHQQVVSSLDLEDLHNQESHPPSQGQQASSRPSIQAQAGDNSIRQYRSHFHPSEAIRKFRHAKHNSADFQQKSLQSGRINHSLSTLRRNGLTLQSCERVKSRLEKNKTRFRTRLAQH